MIEKRPSSPGKLIVTFTFSKREGIEAMFIVGDFNGWDVSKNRMERLDTGVFVSFVQGVHDGDCYKYSIQGYDGLAAAFTPPLNVLTLARHQLLYIALRLSRNLCFW